MIKKIYIFTAVTFALFSFNISASESLIEFLGKTLNPELYNHFSYWADFDAKKFESEPKKIDPTIANFLDKAHEMAGLKFDTLVKFLASQSKTKSLYSKLLKLALTHYVTPKSKLIVKFAAPYESFFDQ